MPSQEPETKFCINCGKKMPYTATFCPNCGASQIQEATSTSQNENRQQNKPVNLLSAFILGVKNTFSLKQRTTRPEFWWLYLDLVIISLISSIIASFTIYRYPSFNISSDFFNFPRFIGLTIFSLVMAYITIVQFTASVRRLHDSNHSAHFLWLFLIPIIGPIVLIVLWAQKSQEAGQRFVSQKTNSQKWYKKWWTWLIILLITFIYIFTYNAIGYATALNNYQNNASQSQPSTSVDTSDDSNTDDDDSDTDDTDDSDTSDSVTIGDSDIDVSDSKTYTSTYSNSSWANTNFKMANSIINPNRN